MAIFFQPEPNSTQNQEVYNRINGSVQQFQVALDFRDILSISKLRGANIGGQNQTLDIKSKYVFDYYLKLSLCCSDGDFMNEREQSFQIDQIDQSFTNQ